MSKEKTPKLRISNMVFTGKMPFKRKLKINEGNELIKKYNWFLVNEENSPILSKRIKLREKIELSVHNKEKQPYVSIWYSGAINIVGVISRKEANQVYNIVIKELKKVSKGLLR